MLSDYLSTVDWSRAQFAMTAIYHWLFVPLTLGLGFMIAIMETLYVRTKDPFWLRSSGCACSASISPSAWPRG